MPVPNVQWKTPDDAQRICPKHVELRTKINLEISSSVDDDDDDDNNNNNNNNIY